MTNKNNCFTLFATALVLALYLACPGSGHAKKPIETIAALEDHPAEGTVTWVGDSNTLKVTFKKGSTLTVTLLGVDVPRQKGKAQKSWHKLGMATVEGLDEAAGVERLEGVAATAVQFLSANLLHQQVRLEVPAAGAKDPKGRLRAFVYRSADGLQINTQLVEMGLAFIDVYVHHPYDQQLAYAQAIAYSHAANLWAPAGTKSFVLAR